MNYNKYKKNKKEKSPEELNVRGRPFKVLHVFCVAIKLRGSGDQMLYERDAAMELGLDFHTSVFGPQHDRNTREISVMPTCTRLRDDAEGNDYTILEKLLLRVQFYLWLYGKKRKYDVVIIRYNPYDPLQIIFNLFFRKKKIYIFHGKADYELRLQDSVLSRAKLCLEKIVNPLVIKTSDGVVGVTEEISVYYSRRLGREDKFSYVYPNGVFLSDEPIIDRRAPKIELIFVASYFFKWIGLEQIIESVLSSDAELFINIVGSCSNEQKALAKGDPRLVFHGFKPTDELREIASRCSVALSPFAMTTKGLSQSSALKTRDYLSLGLPVYAGHPDIFPLDFEYYRVGPAKICDIQNYITDLGDFIKSDVRQAASKYIDKTTLVKDFYNKLATYCSR